MTTNEIYMTASQIEKIAEAYISLKEMTITENSEIIAILNKVVDFLCCAVDSLNPEKGEENRQKVTDPRAFEIALDNMCWKYLGEN